jgi:hypothetical protein
MCGLVNISFILRVITLCYLHTFAAQFTPALAAPSSVWTVLSGMSCPLCDNRASAEHKMPAFILHFLCPDLEWPFLQEPGISQQDQGHGCSVLPLLSFLHKSNGVHPLLKITNHLTGMVHWRQKHILLSLETNKKSE